MFFCVKPLRTKVYASGSLLGFSSGIIVSSSAFVRGALSMATSSMMATSTARLDLQAVTQGMTLSGTRKNTHPLDRLTW